MAVGNLSILFLIGFAVGCVGLILLIIGVATNEWETNSLGSFKLWKECPKLMDKCFSYTYVLCVAILICIIVWGATIHDEAKALFDVGYSYILSIIANALIPAGGFLLFVGGKS